MDFISDALANVRLIKVLTTVNDFTGESVDLVAQHAFLANTLCVYWSELRSWIALGNSN